MSDYHTCVIGNCQNKVQPMHEVDIGVGILRSNEAPICEECRTSQDKEVKRLVNEALAESPLFPSMESILKKKYQ